MRYKGDVDLKRRKRYEIISEDRRISLLGMRERFMVEISSESRHPGCVIFL